jgi:ubiquinone/menaquinone biosynthesis C-methylase UbiE
MPTDRSTFDAEASRTSWDSAADAWEQGQASGRDFYRHEFFGPIQATICGDVGGLRLLDVGCGTGYFTREMAQRGARVTGIDIAPRMIEHAKRHEASSPLGVEYRVGNAAEIGMWFAAASFDMATSCMALQDMADIPAVLRAVHDVLKPGGRFIASITHPCTDTPFREWQRDEVGRKRGLCIDRSVLRSRRRRVHLARLGLRFHDTGTPRAARGLVRLDPRRGIPAPCVSRAAAHRAGAPPAAGSGGRDEGAVLRDIRLGTRCKLDRTAG